MTINKYKSSKELKEAMQNVERVVNFKDDAVEVHADLDLLTADAYDQDITAQAHVEEVLDELEDKVDETITPESPAAEIEIKNEYTAPLKLDEGLTDFNLTEARTRISARDENDTDLYLDYDMSEFVYELLSAGSKGITNIAPKTPLVEKTRNGKTGMYPMKRFSPNGSQVMDREAILLLDLSKVCSRDVAMGIKKLSTGAKAAAKEYAAQADGSSYATISAFDKFFAQYQDEVADMYDTLHSKFRDSGIDKQAFVRDVLGYAFVQNTKVVGSPQIVNAGYNTVIYSNDPADLEEAKEGVATLGIKTGDIVPKRSFTSHWDYSMEVYAPTYEDGEPMLLEDYLEEHNLQLDDVFVPEVATRFRNAYAKADARNAEVTKKIADEKYLDDIIDQYAEKSLDIDPDDRAEMENLFAEMCAELAAHDIACGDSIKQRFTDETGYEFDEVE